MYPLMFRKIQEHINHVVNNKEFYFGILNPTSSSVEDELCKVKQENEVLNRTLQKTKEDYDTEIRKKETERAVLKLTVDHLNKEIERMKNEKVSQDELTCLNRNHSRFTGQLFDMMVNHYTAIDKLKKEVQTLDNTLVGDLEKVGSFCRQNNIEYAPFQKGIGVKTKNSLDESEETKLESKKPIRLHLPKRNVLIIIFSPPGFLRKRQNKRLHRLKIVKY